MFGRREKVESKMLRFCMFLVLLFVINGESMADLFKGDEGDDETRLEGISLDMDALKGVKQKHGEVSLVTVEQLNNLLQTNSDNVRLIDVRQPHELEEVGKIGVAVNIPLGELETALTLSDDDFKAKYNMKKPTKDDCNLIFYCRSGVRSAKAATLAKQHGYTCPKSMKGGFNEWTKMLASASSG